MPVNAIPDDRTTHQPNDHSDDHAGDHARRAAGRAAGRVGRLLVVDFDFFFPNPLDAGTGGSQAWRLYDWGHAETRLHRELIWPIRAAAFAAAGVPLPRCEPTDRFWQRFTLATDLLVVADSNAHAGLLPTDGVGEVVLFDAHHDSGYHRRYSDFLTDRRFSCEDWTFVFHEAGARISVRYPRWRANWPTLEPATAIPVDQRTDDGGPVDGEFDTVFACRSGSWVPAWCDDQWQQLLDAFPGTVISVDDQLRPRWPQPTAANR